MSLVALMIQESPSWVYQPGPQSSDPKIHIIQPSLVIADSPFFSLGLLTLKLLLPSSGIHMNIIILDDHISYIPYIFQVPSTSPISDQFTMNTCRNSYVVAIDNEYPSLAYSSVQLLCDKQKRSRSSSVRLTLDRSHLSTLTSLEEHCTFFDQCGPLLEPTICHHFFSPFTLINLLILTNPPRDPDGLKLG